MSGGLRRIEGRVKDSRVSQFHLILPRQGFSSAVCRVEVETSNVTVVAYTIH